MATPRPKKFTAVKPFHLLGGGQYDTGDEVSGGDLAHTLRFGDEFVTSDRTQRVEAPTEPASTEATKPES